MHSDWTNHYSVRMHSETKIVRTWQNPRPTKLCLLIFLYFFCFTPKKGRQKQKRNVNKESKENTGSYLSTKMAKKPPRSWFQRPLTSTIITNRPSLLRQPKAIKTQPPCRRASGRRSWPPSSINIFNGLVCATLAMLMLMFMVNNFFLLKSVLLKN